VDEVIRIRTGERGHEAIMYDNDIDTRVAEPAKNGQNGK